MRDDDKRQLVARDRTILGDSDDDGAEFHLACRSSARRPDPYLQRRERPIGRNLDELEAGGMRQRGRKT